MPKLFCSLALCTLIFSCQSPKNRPSINGVWQSLGSGWVVHIQDSTHYALYDRTTSSCFPSRSAELSEILPALQLVSDTLHWKKGVITYYFTRTSEVPEPCQQVLSDAQKKDPIYNFEVFAETVQENYAFMELNHLSWEALYAEQKAKLLANPTNTTLYTVLEETQERLNDNHAYLEADDQTYAALEALAAEETGTHQSDIPEIGDFQIAQQVAQHHLKHEMTRNSWLLQWGELEDGIGYIQIKAMWLHADLDISEALIESEGYVDAYVQTLLKMYEGTRIDKEVAGIRKTMQRVMADLSDMDAIVLDVRFNGGGQDAVSFEILRWFNNEKRPIVHQKLKYGSGFSPTTILELDGMENAFTRPIYVLTSPQTGSAAEAFTIATLSLPNAKRIGTATSGALSTALEKQLPNGWSFALSNEIYMDLEDRLFENTGVPVDFRLAYPTERQLFFRSVAQNLEKDKADILNAIRSFTN
ncbi:MAG: S41 family peptidase [Bacteroidota bacterium]